MVNMNSMMNTGLIFQKKVKFGCLYIRVCWYSLCKYVHVAKNMINRLLTFDPKRRVTAEEALDDPWIISNEDNGINLAPNVRKNFNSRRTLKSIVTAVAAINRLKINDHHGNIEE